MNNNIKGVINRAAKLNTFENHKVNVFSHLIKLNPNLPEKFEKIIQYLKENPSAATHCAHLLMGKTHEIPTGLSFKPESHVGIVSPVQEKILRQLLSTSNFFTSESPDKTIEKLKFIHNNLVSAQPEDDIKITSNNWTSLKQNSQIKIQDNIKQKMLIPESTREDVLKDLNDAIDASTACVNRGLLPTKDNLNKLGINISNNANEILQENIKEFNILATHKNESSYFFNVDAQTNNMKNLKEQCSKFYPTSIINYGNDTSQNTPKIMKTKETSGFSNDCLCNSILGTGNPLKTNQASEIKKSLGNPTNLKLAANFTLTNLKNISNMEPYFESEKAIVTHLLSTYLGDKSYQYISELESITDNNYDKYYRIVSENITRFSSLDMFVAPCFIAMGVSPKINISINAKFNGTNHQLFIDNKATDTTYIQHRDDYDGLLSKEHFERLDNDELKSPNNLHFSTKHKPL